MQRSRASSDASESKAGRREGDGQLAEHKAQQPTRRTYVDKGGGDEVVVVVVLVAARCDNLRLGENGGKGRFATCWRATVIFDQRRRTHPSITNNSFPHLSNGDNVFSARRHRRQGSPARSSRLDRRQAGAERPEGDRCPLRGHPDLGLLLPCQARVRRLYAQAPLGQAFKVGPLPPPRAVPHPVQGDPWHGPSQGGLLLLVSASPSIRC